MLAEIANLIRHAPSTLAMKRRMPQDELYATLIARLDASGLADHRRAIVTGLRGHVVEVGCGTGSMFPYYAPPIERVTAIEPDRAFAERARAAASTARIPIDVREGRGEALPLPDASVDAIVLALVLCSVPSVDDVCAELVRVLRPGGQLRLIEHVRSDRRVASALMHAFNPLWLAVNGQGCRMNRDPLPALTRAGLDVEHVVPFQVFSAGIPAFPMREIYVRKS